MTHDPSPDRETGSGRLWTDPREEDEHQHWLRPRIPPPAAPEPDDDGDRHELSAAERRARRLLPFMLAALAAAMLLGAGVLGANILNKDQTASVAPLPVVKGAAPADQRSKTVRSIYASVSPSVVRIQVQEGGSEASGTGFVIDRGGTIVTNAHVVGSATTAQVRHLGGVLRLFGVDQKAGSCVCGVLAHEALERIDQHGLSVGGGRLGWDRCFDFPEHS